MIFKRLFGKPDAAPRAVYLAIVAAARHPVPYAEWGVPDTLDGRFDLMAVHAFLVLDRLKGRAPEFRQELVDELFRDMDRSVRELGVNDVSVGKKVRRMAEVFYGRAAAYDKALASTPDRLQETLARNIYPQGAAPSGIASLAAHVRALRGALADQSEADIVAGRIAFTEPRS